MWNINLLPFSITKPWAICPKCTSLTVTLSNGSIRVSWWQAAAAGGGSRHGCPHMLVFFSFSKKPTHKGEIQRQTTGKMLKRTKNDTLRVYLAGKSHRIHCQSISSPENFMPTSFFLLHHRLKPSISLSHSLPLLNPLFSMFLSGSMLRRAV